MTITHQQGTAFEEVSDPPRPGKSVALFVDPPKIEIKLIEQCIQKYLPWSLKKPAATTTQLEVRCEV